MILNKKSIILSLLVTLLAMPLLVLADYPGQINIGAAAEGIIAFVSGLFGVFAVIMFIFAGFLFLSANGETSKVHQAQQAVLWGVVGIIIALMAYGMVGAIGAVLGV